MGFDSRRPRTAPRHLKQTRASRRHRVSSASLGLFEVLFREVGEHLCGKADDARLSRHHPFDVVFDAVQFERQLVVAKAERLNGLPP